MGYKGSRAKTEVARVKAFEILVERQLQRTFMGVLGREENQLSFPSLQLSVDWTFGNQWNTPIFSHEA